MRGFLAEHLGAFDPEEIRILVAAFDEAWGAVQASGVIFDRKAKADTARAILAKHIIAAAKDGEYDEVRLRDGALGALAQSKSVKCAALLAPAIISALGKPDLTGRIGNALTSRDQHVNLVQPMHHIAAVSPRR